MKATIGRIHEDYLILVQLDCKTRTWTTTRIPRVRRDHMSPEDTALVVGILVIAVAVFMFTLWVLGCLPFLWR